MRLNGFQSPLVRWSHLAMAVLFVRLVLSCTVAQTQPPVTALAFAPSGNQIVVGSQAGVSIREWPSLKNVVNHVCEFDQIQDLRFSPDGTRLLVVGGSPSEFGKWQLLAWPDLTSIESNIEHDDVIYAAVWLSEDEFVTGSADNQVIRWRMSSGSASGYRTEIFNRLTGHSRRVLSVESLDSGQWFVSAGVDQSLRVWGDDERLQRPMRVLDNHTDIVRDLAKRPGDHSIAYLASASADKTVRIWQPSIGRLVRFARLPVEPLCIAWTADGNRIGVGCVDGKLRVVNANTVKIEQTLAAIDGWAYTVLAAPDDSFVVGGSSGSVMRLLTDSQSP